MKLPMILLMLAASAYSQSTQVKACAVLTAAATASDTERIQQALNLCSPGKAVILKSDAGNQFFQSAPLILPRGVTLFIDRGVTLYASRNPRDYDLAPGSCGAAPRGNAATCKPFLYAYQAAYSGVAGAGAIDGQGVASELVSSYESQGFKIAGVTLRNAAGVHAAIFKTIGLTVSGLKIESPENSAASAGLLLSNAVSATVDGLWIRAPGDAIALKASILGATSSVAIRDAHIFGGRGISIGDDMYGSVRDVSFDGVSIDGARAGFTFNLKGTQGGEARQIHASHICLRDAAEPVMSPPAGRDIAIAPSSAGCQNPGFASAPQPSFTVDLSTVSAPGKQRSITVAPGGSIRQAVDALPLSGGDITVQPGTYREVVTIRKPHVHLHGADADPAKTVIVYNNGATNSGGTFNSSTVFVEADDVTIDHLSIVNDLGAGKGQAVALHVTADRAIFRNLRITGAQDTLFAASRYCYGDYGPCVAARQYFADCYIEGNTDFIFGDSMAVFDRCEIHGIDTGSVMYTAQSRHTAEQTDSGYIFDHCHLTGKPRGSGAISLGRSWRPYATVVFLQAQIDAPVTPEGWTEWERFGKPTLPTAFYAEYESAGPGADAKDRERYSHQLTAAEAEHWSPRKFLAGKDGWNP
ncbi:MAG: pectinesterase family protein [Bryobacteraceae bacterium]|jgi:pectinesterase